MTEENGPPPNVKPLLEVTDLCKHFQLKGGFFDRSQGVVKAVDGVSFSIMRGTSFGLVGESGCGKTTTSRLIMRVIEPSGGQIAFRDRQEKRFELTALSPRQMRPLRRNIQMIFQDPYASLDPRMTILRIVGEPLRACGLTHRKSREKVAETLRLVGLRPEYMSRYPHAFSGGQRQRIGIARALVTEPDLVVADEPVSSLDVSVQAQVLNLLQDLRARLSLSYLFIAHDMSVVRHFCEMVGVMYVGRLVEVAPRAALFGAPRHPYTEALLSAVPRLGPQRTDKKTLMVGSVADSANLPAGCCFHPRCRYKQAICEQQAPQLRQVGPQHTVSCHFDLPLQGV